MKLLGSALLACFIAAPSLPAAELASAADQYTQEGAVSAAPVAPPPAPLVLPRTVWPRIELADGRVLEKARANTVDALTVTFLHSGGATKVDRRLLPPELAAVFPFDPYTAGREAREQAAERAASARAQARREEKVAQRSDDSASRASRIVTPSPAPAQPDPSTIEAAVRLRARRYFENEKRNGSGATLAFDIITELDDPEPVSGWENRWEIKGVASYKVYDSIGWGSFSARTRKFRALVETPPGKNVKVVSFDER